MTEQMEPKLRFKDKNNNDYPDWETKKLHQIIDVKDGTHESPKPTDDGYLLVTSKNLKNSTLDFSESYSISKEDYEDINKRSKVEIGDILFGMIGTIGNPILLEKDGFAIKNVALLKTSSLQEREYILNFLKSNSITKQFYKLNVGGTQKFISLRSIRDLKIDIPSSEEAIKIGGFFSKLDRQIELEEEKLELLEQQKKGYMQKIFSQELRFKDDNGNSYPDWSIKKIEDISKVNKGFTPNTKNDEYWDELNENWLSIAGMTQKYLYKGNKGITEKGASKHVKVDKDTLIMSFKLTLGKLAIVKEPIYTNEAICHFVWKESNINTEYMYYYLNSINISTFGAQAVKGVTLNNDSINSIIVKLPVIQEQNKIAYFFNELDKLIRKQYAKIEVLKQRKKGLLQKMFI